MPLHLEPLDVMSELENVGSVLIVSCPICPPVSLAIQNRSPLLELFRRGIKTGAFEDHIKEIRQALEQRGAKTEALCMYTPVPTMCLWTRGQRKRLLKRAADFEAVLVLGCESAFLTVQRTLQGTGCRVVLAMRLTGITNATVKFEYPLTVKLVDTTCLPKDQEDVPNAVPRTPETTLPECRR